MLSKKFFLVFLFLVPIVMGGELSLLGISNSTTVPDIVYSGDLITLNFDVENTSAVGRIASDINVFIKTGQYFEPIKIQESIDRLTARDIETVSMRFRAKENVLPGNYKFPVFLTYDSGTTLIEDQEEVSFTVSSCQVIKIENISLSDLKPHIGDTLTISAELSNECSTSLRNLVVTLEPVSNDSVEPFIVSSGTSRKIGEISPNGSEKVEFELVISDKVDAETYVFSIDATCEDCSKSFSNSFSFLVLGKPELIISGIEYSVDDPVMNDKEIMQGNSFTLSVQLDNIGEEKAKAVDVEVLFDEEDSFDGVKKAFLGNIDPDDSGAGIFNLRASPTASSGLQEASIIISYTDESNERQSIVESYSLSIAEQPPTSPIVYLFILIFVIIALALLFVIIRFVFRQLAIRKAQSR